MACQTGQQPAPGRAVQDLSKTDQIVVSVQFQPHPLDPGRPQQLGQAALRRGGRTGRLQLAFDKPQYGLLLIVRRRASQPRRKTASVGGANAIPAASCRMPGKRSSRCNAIRGTAG